MACAGCRTEGLSKAKPNKPEQNKCSVCVGIHNDHAIKTVYYCYVCGEWICEACETNWMNRGMAAVKKLFRFT